ncbi:uncharacterized protein FIBRA_07469 [Fibroporia radiculosa]|uniref:L-lysine 6-oxidase n=1 Tax=Fibroporia radiculosa TaxID=599839 RepID=J4H4M7_9APHY|nr:uncharacterized protein FIBRA_07469 [Fibroporia radiculosa]CCM05259.1 predicted protein [Fibroporia radiculosa]
MSIDPTEISYIQIFPPIGIARLGDSGFNLDTGEPDGDIEYFLSPEVPGSDDVSPAVNNSFRDSKYRIKRMVCSFEFPLASVNKKYAIQAVRFRAYAYDKNGKNLGEIKSGDKSQYTLTWTVHVANHKGAYHTFRGQYSTADISLRNPDVQPTTTYDNRTDLIVDAQEQQISGLKMITDLKGGFKGSKANPVEVHLGQIRTDEHGRLIFIGGAGYSRSVADPSQPHFQPDIISAFDSIDWVDDTCDGWVNVTVKHPDLAEILAALQKSTILVAPPRFVWGIQAPTTLYDLIANIYNKEKGWKDHEGTLFYWDIWPVLLSCYTLSWVNNEAYQGHGVAGMGNFLPIKSKLATPGKAMSDAILRDRIFKRLRAPDYEKPDQASTKFMPRLSGDGGDLDRPGEPIGSKNLIRNFAALTKLQYDHFSKWKDGDFLADDAPWSSYKDIESVPTTLQPLFLTRAALEHTIGEPLYPGIEMSWEARESQMYVLERHPSSKDSDPPFRINHDLFPAGHVCRGLSLPWQSDFNQCNTYWWPSSRPDDIINILSLDGLPHGVTPSRPDPTIRDISVDEFIKTVSPQRRKWSRGIRNTPEFPSSFYPGSTDMVRFWQKLGFVTKLPDTTVGGLPMWLESERVHIDRSRSMNRGVITAPFSNVQDDID